ncbi:RNA polymerase II subunit A C-terminal domain phosphatase [Gracilariopsis chorda]|uniref:RNA polymerase II subunit A C-terminal domain phosphatase n=1 Tax=Gracilariopsis chorda TaxID=448386 RepID=A0A2V3J4T6_9FLOR|nr:RNA polymerase II subunit A C-terminal domain phosphatase [Gracilariopsis chorda]|eukprot:PXF49132.1 RNA polymerase II subunit A C-terminal domain phosphatase [Gracilariopsis chorda]
MRGYKQEHVQLPERVLQQPAQWRLDRWLVNNSASVHREQRLATFKSLSTGAVEYAFAPRSGKIVKTFIQQSSTVDPAASALALIEFCTHAVVFKGICAICGETAQSLHFAETKTAVERIPVAYDSNQLAVSRAEAESIASVNARNLLHSQRLSLVLDLDHTLVHATDDPRAPQVINHFPPDADLHSVKAFALAPVIHPNAPPLMHVKLRPHLFEFLHRLSNKFELHIYTMGTRPYADQIANLIDPHKKLFGGRITSREDFEEGRWNQKSIQRLFPCDDSMVLIVDDREDVWISSTGQSFMPNLIRADPYHFWDGLHEAYDRVSATNGRLSTKSNAVGTTDTSKSLLKPNENDTEKEAPRTINGNALHVIHNTEYTNGTLAASGIDSEEDNTRTPTSASASPDTALPDAESPASEPQTNAFNGVSADRAQQERVHDGDGSSGDGPSGDSSSEDGTFDGKRGNGFAEQAKEHSTPGNATAADDTPPASLLDEHSPVPNESAIPDASGTRTLCENADSSSTLFSELVNSWWKQDADPKASNHLLKLAEVLEECHSRFFSIASQAQRESGAVNKGPAKRFRPPADVKRILASVRREVLQECVVCFTGVIPTGVDPHSSPYWSLAKRLGAQCSLEYENGHTTHLVTSETRGRNTRKYKQAMESGAAYVISPAWLDDSAVRFERQDEFDYQLDKDDRFKSSNDYRSWINNNFAKAASSCRKRNVTQLYENQAGAAGSAKRRKVDSPSRNSSLRGSECRSPMADGMVSVLTADEIGAAIEAAFGE